MTDHDLNVWPRPDSIAGRVRAQLAKMPAVDHNAFPVATPAEPEDVAEAIATEPATEPEAPSGPKPDPSQGQQGTSLGITARTSRDRIRAIAAGRADALLNDPTVYNH